MIEVDPLLSPRDTADLVGLARVTLFDLVKAGKFPKPIRVSAMRTAFSSTEVAQWIEARKAERDAGYPESEMRRRAMMAVEARWGKKKAVAAG